MVTARDRVWIAALQLKDRRKGFDADALYAHCGRIFDDDPPSKGTVRNTLNAMTKLGVVDRLGKKGSPAHYIDGEHDWA